MLRYLFIFAVVAALWACDTRPAVQSDSLAFSTAGIQLGMSRGTAPTPALLDNCTQEGERYASCLFTADPKKEHIFFLGARVESINYLLTSPGDRVDHIKVRATGDLIYDHHLEMKLDLKGRCLNHFSADRVAGYSSEARAVMRLLLDAHYYPAGLNSSLCLSPTGQFVSVMNHQDLDGKKTLWVEMYTPPEANQRLLERALEFQAKMAK